MSKVIRSVKNVTKGYSSVQVKVREGSFAKRRKILGALELTSSFSDQQ